MRSNTASWIRAATQISLVPLWFSVLLMGNITVASRFLLGKNLPINVQVSVVYIRAMHYIMCVVGCTYNIYRFFLAAFVCYFFPLLFSTNTTTPSPNWSKLYSILMECSYFHHSVLQWLLVTRWLIVRPLCPVRVHITKEELLNQTSMGLMLGLHSHQAQFHHREPQGTQTVPPCLGVVQLIQAPGHHAAQGEAHTHRG